MTGNIEQCLLGGYTLCANYIDEQGNCHPKYFELKIEESNSIVFIKSLTNVFYQKAESKCQTNLNGLEQCDTICFAGMTAYGDKLLMSESPKVFDIPVEDLPEGLDFESIHKVISACCPECVDQDKEVQAEEIEKVEV